MIVTMLTTDVDDEFLQTFLTDCTLKPRRLRRFRIDCTSCDKTNFIKKILQENFLKLKKEFFRVEENLNYFLLEKKSYIACQQVRLACQNDGKDLTLWQRLAERQHQVISNGFHHLHGAGELIVGQVQHRSWIINVSIAVTWLWEISYLSELQLKSRSLVAILQSSTCTRPSYHVRPKSTLIVGCYRVHWNSSSSRAVAVLDAHHSSHNLSRRSQAVGGMWKLN